MKSQSAPDRTGIQVIARASSILRVIAQRPRGMTLAEIATELELARSTVQRIVSALIEEQLLISAGARAGFMLGPALLRLAAAAIGDTERLVRPVLEALSAETAETVDLSVLQSDRALFVDQVIGSQRLVAASAIGASFPLHPTANGKALLSRLPRARRELLIPATLERCTGQTLISKDALRAAVDEAARTGLAWDLEEHAEGVCAIGAAFTNRMGRHFAVSIPVPSTRFATRRDALASALRHAMKDIAALEP